MTACAFVVGIDEYPEASGMDPLDAAVRDALDFADWALDDAGGAVAHADMHLWTWPPPVDPPERVAQFLAHPTAWFQGNPALAAPTKAQITQSIFEVMTQAGGRGLTRAYVFLAGHGVEADRRLLDEPPATCFMAADYVPRFADGLVPCDDLQQAMRTVGTAEVAMFFDCCRTKLNATDERPHLGWPNYEGYAFQRLAAGRAAKSKQRALEVATPNGKRGAFTYMVTYALRHLRTEDRLTAEQLENYVSEQVAKLALPNAQNPEFVIHPRDGNFVVVVGAPPPGPTLRLRFRDANVGRKAYLVDGRLEEVAVIEAAPAVWEQDLPIGKYSLEFDGERKGTVILHFGPEVFDVEV